jgi:hypothetical protein
MRLLVMMCVLLLAACQTMTHDPEEMSHEDGDEVLMEEYCQFHECRGPTSVRLRTEHGDFDETFPFFWPVIQEGNLISILPGEELLIEIEYSDQQIQALRHVESVRNPGQTLVLDFRQSEGSVGMVLSITNPLDAALKFSLQAMDFEGMMHETISCPVMAGGSLFETWPHAIPQLVLLDPRMLAPGDSLDCQY